MPLTLSFTEPSTFVFSASGHVTYAECGPVYEALLTHPHFRKGARILVDGRTVTKAPSTEEVRALSDWLRALTERGVHSLGIVTNSTLTYGLARMFSMFAEVLNFRVAVFKTMEEGERWLTDTPESA
jgi:hypothetical protein